MRLPDLRPGVLFLAVPLCLSSPLSAQSPQRPAPTVRCFDSGMAVGTVGGAALGAWIGFVAAKIKLSDWNDASRSDAAHRSRNRATFTGAAIGAVIGNLAFRGRSCSASRQQQQLAAPQQQSRRPITHEEIERSGINGNAYDLVYSLRRSWLNVRGVQSISEGPHVVEVGEGQQVMVQGEPQLVIYLDNARLGTISQLRNISVAGVVGVRYFDGPQATYRWGAGHSHGAIQVLTVSDGPP